MTEERQERSNLFCSSVGREDYDLCRVTGRARQVRDVLFSRSNLHIFTFTLPRWLSALNRGRDRSTQSPSDLSRRCPEALSSSLERFGQTSNKQITILRVFPYFWLQLKGKDFYEDNCDTTEQKWLAKSFSFFRLPLDVPCSRGPGSRGSEILYHKT